MLGFARSGFLLLIALAAAGCGGKPRDKVCAASTFDAACGCTRVMGDLAIDAAVVRDVRCLKTLREVGGKLSIGAKVGAAVLSDLRGLEQLQRVKALELSGLAVRDLTVFINLRVADRVKISQLDELTDLRGLRADIRQLVLDQNAKLRSLHGFAGLPARADVSIESQPALESLDGLLRSSHQPLERLQLLGLPKIASVDLRSASELGALVVRSCTALRSIRGVESIAALRQLHLTGLTTLPKLPEFAKLRSVGDLELIELPLIADLQPLSSLNSVDNISLNMLDGLKTVLGLEHVERARRILLEDLLALETLEGLRGLRSVDTLWVAGDDALESLRGLQLNDAGELAVRYNDKLQNLAGLESLAKLGTLDVSENAALISARGLAGLREPAKVFARANSRLPQCELDALVTRLPAGSTHEFSANGPPGKCR